MSFIFAAMLASIIAAVIILLVSWLAGGGEGLDRGQEWWYHTIMKKPKEINVAKEQAKYVWLVRSVSRYFLANAVCYWKGTYFSEDIDEAERFNSFSDAAEALAKYMRVNYKDYNTYHAEEYPWKNGIEIFPVKLVNNEKL